MVLVALHHLHVWWAIPLGPGRCRSPAHPSRRYRSAWIGIAVHSAKTVFLGVGVFLLVV